MFLLTYIGLSLIWFYFPTDKIKVEEKWRGLGGGDELFLCKMLNNIFNWKLTRLGFKNILSTHIKVIIIHLFWFHDWHANLQEQSCPLWNWKKKKFSSLVLSFLFYYRIKNLKENSNYLRFFNSFTRLQCPTID